MNQGNYPFSIALAGLCLATMVGQSIPLPIVARDRTQPTTVFTRPALVVLVSIFEKRLLEERNMDGESFVRPRVHRLVSVELQAVIRTNERLSTQSDLGGRQFLLKMDDTDVELEFGKSYILMVNYAPPMALGAPLVPKSAPLYVLALKDVGFEDDGTRVHVLRRGGELSAYDGKLSSDVHAAIERGR